MNNFFYRLILLTPVFLLSLSVHEASHGKMADLLGDPTPERTGRLTLNPMAHLSFMGTMVLLLTMMSGWIMFGWAKPVQINPRTFDDPKRGMMLVGLAGPLSNLLLAVILGISFELVHPLLSQLLNQQVLIDFFGLSILLNIGLAIFNSLPIPPLDGSKILDGLLPAKYDYIMENLRAYGAFALLLLVFTGGINYLLSPLYMLILQLPAFRVVNIWLMQGGL